jgi:uncharacterized membrane protein YqjE
MSSNHMSDREMSEDRSFSRILKEIVNHFAAIIRSELELARTEVGQDIKQVAGAGAIMAFGVLFTLYAFGFVGLSAVYALETTLAPWLSALIVGAVAGIIALVFLQIGRSRMKLAGIKPDKTIQSLQENFKWTTKQTR